MHAVGTTTSKRPPTGGTKINIRPESGFRSSYRTQSRRRSFSSSSELPILRKAFPLEETTNTAVRNSSAPPRTGSPPPRREEEGEGLEWCTSYPAAPLLSDRPARAATAEVRPQHAATLTLSTAQFPEHYSASPFSESEGRWGTRPPSHSVLTRPPSSRWNFLTKDITSDAPSRVGKTAVGRRGRKPVGATEIALPSPSSPPLFSASGRSPRQTPSAPYRPPRGDSGNTHDGTPRLSVEEWTVQSVGEGELHTAEDTAVAKGEEEHSIKRDSDPALSIHRKRAEKLEEKFETILRESATQLNYSEEERRRLMQLCDGFVHHDVRLQSAVHNGRHEVQLDHYDEEDTDDDLNGDKGKANKRGGSRPSARPKKLVEPSAVLPMQPAWSRAAEDQINRQKKLADLSRKNAPEDGDKTWNALGHRYAEDRSVNDLLQEHERALQNLQDIEKANELSFNNLMEKY